MSAYRTLLTAVFLFSSVTFVAEAARGADFRVENTVFAEGQTQPQSQGVTIFEEGVVYDFLNDPAEVIVFDKAQQRFTLLDISRRLRSEISISDVQAYVNRARQRLAGHPNPNVKWLADPSFEESFDRETSELTLNGPSIAYRVQVQATLPAVAAQYREFSDWYAQFNHMINPASWPPFPRMMLNAALERHECVAKEVHLSAALGPNETPIKIVSRHQLVLRLDSSDASRVAKVRDYQQSFQGVSFAEYRKGK